METKRDYTRRVRDLVVIATCLIATALYVLDSKWRIKELFSRQKPTVTFSSISSVTTPDEVAGPAWASSPPEVNPPPDHPPLSILGSDKSYTIHYTTHEWLMVNESGAVTVNKAGGGAMGLAGLDGTIWLYRGDPNPRATVMHELFHMAKYLGDRQHWHNNDPPGQNHEFISSAAPELLIILRRNPRLVTWLMDQRPIMQE